MFINQCKLTAVSLIFFNSFMSLSHADQPTPICKGSSIAASLQGEYDASALGMKTMIFSENSIKFPERKMEASTAWTCHYTDQLTSRPHLFLVVQFEQETPQIWDVIIKSELPPTHLSDGSLYFYEENKKMRVRWSESNQVITEREVDPECEKEIQEQTLTSKISTINDPLIIKQIVKKCGFTRHRKTIYESYPILEQDHALLIYDEVLNLDSPHFTVKLKNPRTLIKNK